MARFLELRLLQQGTLREGDVALGSGVTNMIIKLCNVSTGAVQFAQTET
jgi:hypothetical protein